MNTYMERLRNKFKWKTEDDKHQTDDNILGDGIYYIKCQMCDYGVAEESHIK